MPMRLASNVLGFAILVAVILGGGTQAGLWSDAIVKIVLILASTFAILANRRAVLTPFLLIFPLCILGVFVLQLLPLPLEFVSKFWAPAIRGAWNAADAPSAIGPLTTSVDSTLQMFCEAATAVLFFWACLNVDGADAPRLTQFFVVGWFVHLIAALIEFAVTNFSTITTALPYPINAGLFANSNHFGLFMALGIPPLLFFSVKQKSGLSTGLVALVILLLFAVASRSALAIGLLLIPISLALAGAGMRRVIAVVSVGALGVGFLFTAGYLFPFIFKGSGAPVARAEIFATTWRAFLENPVFGSGFGTFLQIYPIYEASSKISFEYVNRAHNDYLETMLEGGLPVIALIAIYLVYLIVMSVRISAMRPSHIRDTAVMALLALIAVLAQSAVDYPLRTWVVLSTFIYCNVILADCVLHHQQAKTARQATKPGARPPEGRPTLMLPEIGRPVGTLDHADVASLRSSNAGAPNPS